MIHVIAALFAVLTPAENLYTQALQHMKSEPQPTYATYSADFQGKGVNLELLRTADGEPSLKVSGGKGSAHASADVAYASAQHRTSVKMPDGTSGITQSPFFSATWLGAYDWLRYGAETGMTAPAPSAQPTAESTPEPLPIIAVVASLGTGNYRVDDDGVVSCPNGEPGNAVRLTAKFDPDHHPLTNATISQKTGAFCAMRFRKPFRGLRPVYVGTLDFHFKDEGGYTVISDEHMEFTAHLMGMIKSTFEINATYSNFVFPSIEPTL